MHVLRPRHLVYTKVLVVDAVEPRIRSLYRQRRLRRTGARGDHLQWGKFPWGNTYKQEVLAQGLRTEFIIWGEALSGLVQKTASVDSRIKGKWQRELWAARGRI